MLDTLSPLAQRLMLLQHARVKPLLRQLLLEACRRNPGFWFQYFCWTVDPRRTPSRLPFTLYPFQQTLVKSLCASIEKGEDLLIEKSRDMGVSWIVLLTFQHYWLFREGSHFLIGSRKADLVDTLGDLSSLMEKCRFNLTTLPAWMRPRGYKTNVHGGLMKLLNPQNGNTLMGESCNAQFGRGGRYKAILMDEFPVWPNDDASFAAAGQASPCRMLVGTPYGKHNRFARLRHENRMHISTLHWRLHPERDATWYEAQKKRLSPEEIASELDICYERSTPDRVFLAFEQRHIRDTLPTHPDRRVIRSWDFGYHTPACVFVQMDDHDRVRVLHEVVGERMMQLDFIRRVLAISNELFAGADFEDICDPAGTQHSDRSDMTNVEILQSQGVYPSWKRLSLNRGIELIRMKLAESIDEAPGFLIARHCRHLIGAFEGGYRYRPHAPEVPVQEHPYEDVMDCLRYAVSHKCEIPSPPRRQRAKRPPRRRDKYTGY